MVSEFIDTTTAAIEVGESQLKLFASMPDSTVNGQPPHTASAHQVKALSTSALPTIQNVLLQPHSELQTREAIPAVDS